MSHDFAFDLGVLTVVYILSSGVIAMFGIDWATILYWLSIGLALGPMVLGFSYVIFEIRIKPALIPKNEIMGLVEETCLGYSENPAEAAYNKEFLAWHGFDMFEQGKWRRVRKLIRRRQAKHKSSCHRY